MKILDYFGGFGCIFAKMDKINKNLGNFWVLRHGVGITCNSVGPRQGVAESGVSYGLEYADVATIHSMEIFVLCFVFLFRYSEDLSIGLMRIL